MRENSDNDRAPPAFQEYAGTLLSLMPYRLMSGLAERGLAWSMRLECWANGSVPADPSLLCRVIGYSKTEIETALTPNVMFFFRVEGDIIVCPELDAYKARLNDRRERQSAGGKTTAAKKNGNRKLPKKRADSGVQGDPTGNRQATSQVTSKLPARLADRSQAKQSTTNQNQNQLTKGGSEDAFVRDIERADAAGVYASASGGGT